MAERLLPLPDMHVAWVRSPVPARLMISVEKCFQGLWQTALLSAEGILAICVLLQHITQSIHVLLQLQFLRGIMAAILSLTLTGD
jgi:hypothetical protein